MSSTLSATNESIRKEQARRRAEAARLRQRGLLLPVGRALIVIVALTTASSKPGLGFQGTSAALTAALVVYVLGVVLWMSNRFIERGLAAQIALMLAIAAAGIAIEALQPHGASDLAAGAVVWMAVARLPLRVAIYVGVLVTVALGLTDALSGLSAGSILATTLLCVLLGLTSHFVKQSRENQDQTELLLAELQDARDDLAQAAANDERARIASELHDVLAHALSGAAIQLQGAKLLAERQAAEPQLRGAIERASELVKEGLGDARRAVGALRGEGLPTVEQLEQLLESFRKDMNVDATLQIEGSKRPLSAEASLALYRGAQEALTNVARYAPSASTSVLLRYDTDRTVLTIEDRVAMGARPSMNGLGDMGGGRGLDGMRERAERAGGHMDAGPTDNGWRVQLEIPA
ncbi:MAG: histidine kinase [Solirubrobacteraceae bacterium]|jgi:signal transduction histidine kinase